MPFPNQTNQQTVIETAARLIEKEGPESLSWGKLAAAVGVKPPSLYRHVKNRDEVLDLVVQQTFARLFERYDEALGLADGSPLEQCLQVAHAQRHFALECPNLYLLAFSRRQPEINPKDDMLLMEALRLQEIVAQFSSEETSLTVLRGLLALIHGFVSLEINGQFRRGGDLGETFDAVVRAYLGS